MGRPPIGGFHVLHVDGERVAGQLKRPCAHPGCPEVVSGTRYCERHRRCDDRRDTAARRGYDGRWQRLREMYLRRHPLCEVCEREGRVTPAVIVHHRKPIKRGGHPLDVENLMSVCRACHDKLHDAGAQMEKGAMGGSKSLEPPP